MDHRLLRETEVCRPGDEYLTPEFNWESVVPGATHNVIRRSIEGYRDSLEEGYYIIKIAGKSIVAHWGGLCFETLKSETYSKKDWEQHIVIDRVKL